MRMVSVNSQNQGLIDNVIVVGLIIFFFFVLFVRLFAANIHTIDSINCAHDSEK